MTGASHGRFLMASAFICEGVRTPIGRYAGALAQIRTDDLAAHPLAALSQQFSKSDWESVDEIYYGCVNQAGEDNRNVARMAALLAGIPHIVPAATVQRLWRSRRRHPHSRETQKSMTRRSGGGSSTRP